MSISPSPPSSAEGGSSDPAPAGGQVGGLPIAGHRRLPVLGGRNFGSLHVFRKNGKLDGFETYLCQCACGTRLTVRGGKILDGTIISCQSAARPPQAGQPNRLQCPHAIFQVAFPEFRAWQAMHRIVGRKSAKKLDPRWKSFDQFLADMGPRPSPTHLLERCPDPKGRFTPDNCRWLPLRIRHRIRNDKWSLDDALNKPVRFRLRPQPPILRFDPPRLSISELARIVGATHWHEKEPPPSSSVTSE